MSEKENAGKKYSPLTYSLYEELKRHVDSENGISAQELADKFGISKRTLRFYISIIRNSPDFELVVTSSNNGYFICSTKEIFKRHHRRLYSMAFSLLREARAQDKKMGLNGQYKIPLDSFDNFFKSFVDEY